MTRPQRSRRAPHYGNLKGIFPEEAETLRGSDNCCSHRRLRQEGRIFERSPWESDGATTDPPSSASSSACGKHEWESGVSSDSEPVMRTPQATEKLGADAATIGADQAKNGPNEKVLYDTCTIRTWFMMMDQDGDGVISKDEFVNFLRERPALQKMLLNTRQAGETDLDIDYHPVSPRMAQAVLQRRLIKLFNSIDVNRSRCMEFEDFLTFFRRAGYLLEYTLTDNPRDRAAELLASVATRTHQSSGSTNQFLRLQPIGSSDSLASVATPTIAYRARRGSECSWAIEQHAKLKVADETSPRSPPRRHSIPAALESPAALWEEPVVLGARRPSGGRCHVMPRTRRESKDFGCGSSVALVDLDSSTNPLDESIGSRLWMRRRSSIS